MENIRFELDCNISIPHVHNEMEILYILTGRMAIIGSGYNYVLSPEDFIVLNPYEHHEMYAEAGCHTISCYISPDIFRQADLGHISCCSKCNHEQKDYLSLIRIKLAILFKYNLNPSTSQKLHVLSQLFGLLAILKTQFEVSGDIPLPMYKDADRMQEVLAYLGTHFSEDITMQEIADRVYLSKGHLSREFQKQVGISFSDYLRKLRLNRAAYLLLHTEKTITDIALSCGFSNTNTMILNFRTEYKETPGSYRKKHRIDHSAGPDFSAHDQSLTASPLISYMSLLKHAAMEEIGRPLEKKHQEMVHIYASLDTQKGKLSLCHNDTISIGWANTLLIKSFHSTLQRAAAEIGFRYVRFHGALDDSIDVYHESSDGHPWLSFTYLDMIIDEILDLGLKPSFEFGYTPYKLAAHIQNVFGSSCVNIPSTPDHLTKWQFLVEGIMIHFMERYGSEELRQWRFSPVSALYTSYGVFSAGEYLTYYEKTFRSIRKILPGAEICGFGLDTGYISLDGPELFKQMLDYCKTHDCIPDIFTFQCFSCDYSQTSRSETEQSITASADRQVGEPAKISEDPDILKHEIAICKMILSSCGLPNHPIHVFEWNSTIWQNDLSNDTCFKSAFLVKNILENCGDISSISYAHITDNTERRVINSLPFHGGYGLFTYNGIPKAGYYAYQLLTILQKENGIIVDQGDGYLITRSENRKKIQIMLYHYCHHDMKNHISCTLPPEAQRTLDRYYNFEQKGVKSFHLHLSGLLEGSYMKRSFSITRDQGSSYDYWMRIGSPDLKGIQQLDYLKNISSFRVHYEPLHINETQELILSTVLDEHEVRLVLIESK